MMDKNVYILPDFHRAVPLKEIEGRCLEFQQRLAEQGCDAALLAYPVDVYYFSGTMQAAHLLIPADGAPLLMVRRDLERARAESPLSRVTGLSGLRGMSMLVNDHLGGPPQCLGLELDVLPVSRFQRYQALWPEAAFPDVGPAILKQRSVKSDYEVDCMARAGDLAARVYGAASEWLRAGETEIEAAGRLTRAAYAGGHQNYLHARGFDAVMYTWHVISGESGGIASAIDAPFGGYGLSPSFPFGASHRVIGAGEPVLVDFGLCLEGYQVDLTRMFSVGEPPADMLEAYQALKSVEAAMLERLYPGVPGSRLYEVAVAEAESLGYEKAFLGPEGRQSRFAGHGVGLEISDPPLLAPGRNEPLQEGMTVALELKMVFPGRGAVGLENTVLVREAGPLKLTPANEDWVKV